MTRYFYLLTGWIFLGLGFLGIIFPVLPTTPFVLVALWAFARSSPQLAERIRNNRYFGQYVQDWEQHRAIPRKAKFLAVIMMTGSWCYLYFYTTAAISLKIAIGMIFLAVASYIITRPASPD